MGLGERALQRGILEGLLEEVAFDLGWNYTHREGVEVPGGGNTRSSKMGVAGACMETVPGCQVDTGETRMGSRVRVWWTGVRLQPGSRGWGLECPGHALIQQLQPGAVCRGSQQESVRAWLRGRFLSRICTCPWLARPASLGFRVLLSGIGSPGHGLACRAQRGPHPRGETPLCPLLG